MCQSSSVVERLHGKKEVVSSILPSGSKIRPLDFCPAISWAAHSATHASDPSVSFFTKKQKCLLCRFVKVLADGYIYLSTSVRYNKIMKNKIISLAIVGLLLGGSLGVPLVQAQTSSQQSTLLASFSQINEAFIQLLASVINALAGQEEENIENDNTTLPPVLSLSQYTVDLLNIANEFKHSPSAKKQAATDRLSKFVQIRKDAMLKEIKNNPQAVINNARPAWAVSQLPQNV